MFDIFKNRLEVVGKLETLTALRVGSGRSTDAIGTDLPVIKDSLGKPIIPGSSFKGAMRSRLESFLRAINADFAKDPSRLTGEDYTAAIRQHKQNAESNDATISAALIRLADPVSRVFGAPWLAGKLQVRDLPVVPSAWFGQYQERDGVIIDRDTETAGNKYDFQIVPAGTTFEFKATVENAYPWELGLIMLGLQQFEQAQVPLGGGRSRGLGVVQLAVESTHWWDMSCTTNDDPDPAKVLAYIEVAASGATPPAETNLEMLKQQWGQALITYLRETAARDIEVPAKPAS